MSQLKKDRLAKAESRQRHATIEVHRDQIISLIKKSEIADPIGVILDITGTYGRQTHKAWNVGKGISEAEAETKIEEMTAYFEAEGKFPTLLTVWGWSDAEKLLPRTSPTATESLRRLKSVLEHGQAGVVMIGRHGNSYAIVELEE